MIKRRISDRLHNFLLNDSRSLLVTGARQVGKTFLIRKIGQECFDNVVEINFVEQPDAVELFNGRSVEQEQSGKGTHSNHLDGVDLEDERAYEGGDEEQEADAELPEIFAWSREVVLGAEQQGGSGQQTHDGRARLRHKYVGERTWVKSTVCSLAFHSRLSTSC